MRRPTKSKETVDATLVRHAISPLGLGVIGRLLCAGGIAALLWIAAAWAMGWLP
jgi:hypothetical protein